MLPEQFAETAFGPHETRIAKVYTEYQRRLQEASAVDFDDMLVLAVRLFREHPTALARWRDHFGHVLVDEFQDTNLAQWELVRMLTEEHRSVMAVGDHDQCLVEGTLVTMGDGSLRAIEYVRAGDEVLSCYGSGDFRPARVLRTHENESSELVQITLASGRTITSTPEHVHFCEVPVLVSAEARGGEATWDHGLAVPLPATRADSIVPGARMLGADGQHDVVASVERVERRARVFDIDVDRTHNFVAGGIVTHNSIYKFRGADFRNIMRFEQAFPDSTVIVLDQNYRSTQHILDAANAVIANNPSHRPKQLWSELGIGEQIVRYQAEDEHDESAFVLGELRRLVEGGDYRYRDIAVFYRTNAQSRVIEEAFVRAGVPYRVFGGTKFYDRREVKDALAYLRRAGESRRRGELEADRQHAQTRRRRHVDRQGRGASPRLGDPVP